MVPTLQATLSVKGHRPLVGTRDCKDVLYVFAVMNLIAGMIHATHPRLSGHSSCENRKNYGIPMGIQGWDAMFRQHELTDSQWEVIRTKFAATLGIPVAPGVDNRLFVNAVMYVAKTGILWADLPSRY